MKTAVTVLHEMMIKKGHLPEYECISQSGPQHHATFEYRCVCQGVSVVGQARSKKEAKQEAAKKMLIQLNARGLPVPPPFATPLQRPVSPPSPSNKPALEPGPTRGPPALTVDARSYVALLKELCDEYRLGEPEYELVGDTGPPHQRHFTMRASLGLLERHATSTTKKAARQLAAEQLYSYLRENLVRLTGDFVEEEALARAYEKRSQEKRNLEAAAQRYAECSGASGGPGPGAGGLAAGAGGPGGEARLDLGLRLSDYHLGLLTTIEPSRLADALGAAGGALGAAGGAEEGAVEALSRACAALGLRAEAAEAGALSVLRLVPASPPLAFAGREPRAAAAAALRYLHRVLRHGEAGEVGEAATVSA